LTPVFVCLVQIHVPHSSLGLGSISLVELSLKSCGEFGCAGKYKLSICSSPFSIYDILICEHLRI